MLAINALPTQVLSHGRQTPVILYKNLLYEEESELPIPIQAMKLRHKNLEMCAFLTTKHNYRQLNENMWNESMRPLNEI